MKQLAVTNPFNAPVYHEETVGSTMEVSRALALRGEPHGTVIVADFQETGRGRISQRPWNMEKTAGLPFTILLRYPRIEDIPPAITLRTGLAVSLAIEDFAPALSGRVLIKWPNDIMLEAAAGTAAAQKVAGILAEANGGDVHIGIGVNVAQKEFPEHLRNKATSIYRAGGIDPGTESPNEARFALLERILARLHSELSLSSNDRLSSIWKSRLEARLYKKGQPVAFAENAAGSGIITNGVLAGIGEGGEILIAVSGGGGDKGVIKSFITGELLLEDYSKYPAAEH